MMRIAGQGCSLWDEFRGYYNQKAGKKRMMSSMWVAGDGGILNILKLYLAWFADLLDVDMRQRNQGFWLNIVRNYNIWALQIY